MNRIFSAAIYTAAFGIMVSSQIYAATLQVGPQRELKLPSHAAKVAKEGDIVEIDSGIYSGDVAIWRQPNLT